MKRIFLFAALIKVSLSTCLLDWELVGNYDTQRIHHLSGRSPEANVTYSRVTIKQDGVSLWGHCHKKIGTSVIFRDVNGCFQCIRLEKISGSLIRVLAYEWNRCYSQEARAELNCPQTHNVINTPQHPEQLFLFRDTDSEVPPTLCPLSGRFLISSPQTPKSVLSTCPNGQFMRLERYFPSRAQSGAPRGLVDLEMECLGHWENGDGSVLLFVQDHSVKEGQARFRCARLKESSELGMRITFSSNATCPSGSPQDGTTYSLQKTFHKPLPSVVAKGSSCRFPTTLLGSWTNMRIGKYAINYKDIRLKQSFSYHCVRVSPRNPERFVIYLKSSCGHEWYGCLWIVQRSPNVLEFQIGKEQSTNPSLNLCSNDQFLKRTWSIEARLVKDKTSLCPITGIYTGQLPDAPILCAKLKSDCLNQEFMMYKVTFCLKKNILYEEREYQCLGQWNEGDHIFTYVKRRGLQSFECFVGKLGNESIYLMESGVTCRRGLQVEKLGMELKKVQSCPKDFQEPIGSNEISEYIKSSQGYHSSSVILLAAWIMTSLLLLPFVQNP